MRPLPESVRAHRRLKLPHGVAPMRSKWSSLLPAAERHGDRISPSCMRRAATVGPLTHLHAYDTVIHMEEVLTIRVPKGTRRRLERRARAENLTLSQYVRRALDTEALLGALEAARADLVPLARAKGVYTDDDVFKIVS